MRKKLIAILLSMSLGVTGCGSINKAKKENKETSEFFKEFEINFDEKFKEKLKLFNDLDFNKIKDNILKNYILLLDEVNPIYNYEEFYITKEEVNSIIEKSKTTKDCDNDEFDFENLFQTITFNSADYEKKHEEEGFKSAFEYVDDSEIDSGRLRRSIMLAIFYNISKSDDSVNNTNICKFKDLKIVVNNEATYNNILAEYLNQEKMIILNMDNIKKNYEKNNLLHEEFSDIYRYISDLVIRHELNHMDSFICSCKEEKGQEYNSIFMNFDSKNGKDYIGKSLSEASATSEIYKEDLTNFKLSADPYINYRKIESLLMLLSVFNGESIDNYYNSIENVDLSAFYRFFCLENEEDIYQFYKILYSLEARELDNNFISNVYPNLYEISYKDAKITVGNACFVDLYKLYLKRLMAYTLENEISLEDNLILSQFGKAVILSESVPIDYENVVYDEDFKNNISKLDEIYNNFIKLYYNFDLSDYEKGEIRISNIDLCEVNNYSDQIFEKFERLKEIYCGSYDLDINFELNHFAKTLN